MAYPKSRKTAAPKAKAAKKPAAKAAKKSGVGLSVTMGPRLIPDLSDPEDSRLFAASIELSNYYRLAGAR